MVKPSNDADDGTVGLLEEMGSSDFVAVKTLNQDLHKNSADNSNSSKKAAALPGKAIVQENGVLKVVGSGRRRSMGAGRMGSDRDMKAGASETKRSRSSSRARMGGLIRNLSNRGIDKEDNNSSSGNSRPGFRKSRSGRDVMPKKPHSQDTIDGSSHHSSSGLNLGRPGFRKSGNNNRDMMPKKPVSQDTVDGSVELAGEERRGSRRAGLRKSFSGRSFSSRKSKDGFEAVSSEEFDDPSAPPSHSRTKLKKTSSLKYLGTPDQTETGGRRNEGGPVRRSSSDNNLSSLGSIDVEDINDEIRLYKDQIRHLENKSEMYRDEFKRVMQEKKKLSSNYVSETSKLHDDIGVLKKKLQSREEENKQLRAALAQAGIQPPPTVTPVDVSESSLNEAFQGFNLDVFVKRRKSMSKLGDEEEALDHRCDVVKGPGLLLTEKHRPKPALFHLPGLRSMPFWTQVDADNRETVVAYQDKALSWVVRNFEKSAQVIAQEYQAKVQDSFHDQEEIKEQGVVLHGMRSTCSFMARGHVKPIFTDHFSHTAAIIQTIRDKGLLFEGTPFGFAFFNKFHRKSRTEGNAPMNMRIRMHLPIFLPGVNVDENATFQPHETCGLRVGPTIRKYTLGKAMLFDDSYSHEIWNNTNSEQVVLVVDLWHPDITKSERKTIIAHSNNEESATGSSWSVDG